MNSLNNNISINEFHINFFQEILALADEYKFSTTESFTTIVTEHLADIGETGDIVYAYHRSDTSEISGFHYDQEEQRLELVISIFSDNELIKPINSDSIQHALDKGRNFFKEAFDGIYSKFEESTSKYDMASTIFENKENIRNIRIILLTNHKTEGNNDIKDRKLSCQYNSAVVSHHIWNIESLRNVMETENNSKDIYIDFVNEYGITVKSLIQKTEIQNYETLLMYMPGYVLAGIYQKWGARLLERNVRSYLQVTTKVNRSIRTTINDNPDMFLAYNNGLSAVATEIDYSEVNDGFINIKTLTGLQIVNGGQTTASVYSAFSENPEAVKNIFVQIKLIIANTETMNQISPYISEFSNSQNNVKGADFHSNSPFHLRIRELSIKILSPAVDGRTRTHWYYENARGNYNTTIMNLNSPSKQREFKRNYPKSQKFNKTDLAKYENSWKQKPHIVSKGAETNFSNYMQELNCDLDKMDDEYFIELVSKMILFKQTQKIVTALQFGGYRANIVTYTVAYISYKTSGHFNFLKIWIEQEINDSLSELIKEISKSISDLLISSAQGRNVTEWAKKEECWKTIKKELDFGVKRKIPEYTNIKKMDYTFSNTKSNSDKDIDKTALIEIQNIGPDKWKELAKYAASENLFTPATRRFCYSIGRNLEKGITLSKKQIDWAKEIINEAKNEGFDFYKNG